MATLVLLLSLTGLPLPVAPGTAPTNAPLAQAQGDCCFSCGYCVGYFGCGTCINGARTSGPATFQPIDEAPAPTRATVSTSASAMPF